MGDLLLCSKDLAEIPFYIEGISIHIYSLEELCYYILKNTYLIERDFMSEELCTWIDKELGQVGLSDSLRDILRRQGKLSDFVTAILESSGYCNKSEILSVCQVIQEMEEKSDFECNKIRADRLMERKKFLSSIYEYKRLITSKEAKEEDPVLLGNIYHNLGVAYARLFLFDEARECFQEAYSRNHKEESLKQLLIVYLCMSDQEGFLATVEAHHMDSTTVEAIRQEVTDASQSQENQRFEEQLEMIASILDSGDRHKYQDTIRQIILKWKEEYRKICRV